MRATVVGGGLAGCEAAWALAEHGQPVRGFDGLLASSLPIGSGLSSSAALEVVTAWALLQRRPAPTRGEVREALAGNLCRCTGYEGIFKAVAREDQE